MADPRATVAFDGIDAEYLTYAYDSSIVYDQTKAGGSASVGLAVTIVASKTVGLAADAQRVEGKLGEVFSDGFCTVQAGGICTLPGGTAATLTPGSKIVGALSGGNKGYIRSVAAATLAEVAVADSEILDAADATAVAVDLD